MVYIPMSTNQGRANAGSQSTQNLARLFRLTNGWTAGNNRFAIDTTDNTKYTKLKTFRELTTSLPKTMYIEFHLLKKTLLFTSVNPSRASNASNASNASRVSNAPNAKASNANASNAKAPKPWYAAVVPGELSIVVEPIDEFFKNFKYTKYKNGSVTSGDAFDNIIKDTVLTILTTCDNMAETKTYINDPVGTYLIPNTDTKKPYKPPPPPFKRKNYGPEYILRKDGTNDRIEVITKTLLGTDYGSCMAGTCPECLTCRSNPGPLLASLYAKAGGKPDFSWEQKRIGEKPPEPPAAAEYILTCSVAYTKNQGATQHSYDVAYDANGRNLTINARGGFTAVFTCTTEGVWTYFTSVDKQSKPATDTAFTDIIDDLLDGCDINSPVLSHRGMGNTVLLVSSDDKTTTRWDGIVYDLIRYYAQDAATYRYGDANRAGGCFACNCAYTQYTTGGATVAKKKPVQAKRPAAKWMPTEHTVLHKGCRRKLWRSSNDAAAFAVKRIKKATDGSRTVRFERVHNP